MLQFLRKFFIWKKERFHLEMTIQIPKGVQAQSLSSLLEEKWLIPRKTRHFLRMRKNVWVNQQPALFAQIVRPTDIVTLRFEDTDYPLPTIILGDKRKISILYEDEHLIVIDKPTGMKTHPNSPGETNTLLNHLAAYLNPTQHAPYVVHRIDQETSGVILFAKNPVVLPVLCQMLERKQIKRRYQAIVAGKFPEKQLTIRKKIGRNRHDRRKYCIDERNGKTACTHITVVSQTNTQSQILCELETGRTHQIRVHLSSIAHPILGDTLYHPHPEKNQRLMLHADTLCFTHPFTEEKLQINSQNFLFKS